MAKKREQDNDLADTLAPLLGIGIILIGLWIAAPLLSSDKKEGPADDCNMDDIKNLEEKMWYHANKGEYDKAIWYRNKIKKLKPNSPKNQT